ncbi:MAG: polysaccharide biosynthesis/export family protein [Candidatus Aminicenantales bacterium]
MKKTLIIFALCFGLVSPFALSGQQEEPSFVKEYRIGPKDLLEITVFELPELNQTVRVSEDGTITLPLLKQVKVDGLTKDELEQRISSLLEEKYLKNPRVSVFIREYQSKLVAVIGAVEDPGMYELIGRFTLLQMITKAGGLKETASNELFVLREGENGATARIAIDLDDLMINGNPDLNIPLQANDVINVPVDKLMSVYVFGAVKNPGKIEVRMSKKITLLQAVGNAGGLADNARKSGIRLKRKDPKTGKETQLSINLGDIIKGKRRDIELLEGDVVIIPESIW